MSFPSQKSSQFRRTFSVHKVTLTKTKVKLKTATQDQMFNRGVWNMLNRGV
jgi:hypothetical protein